MARLQRYLHALASGYLVLAAGAAFALASIPIALHYLQREEFGVWAIASQLALYLSLLDLGVAPAITRILIEHKDGPLLARVVTTAWLAQAVQAAAILVIGAAMATLLSGLLGVQPQWQAPFRNVMLLVTCLVSVAFLSRVFIHLLDAHQRQHITNYAQLLLLAVNFGVLLLCLRSGLGLLSLPLGQLAGWIAQTVFCLAACLRQRLLPRADWRPYRPAFNAFMTLGRDVFLAQCGAQLILGSQVILLGRGLGSDAAATWSVCARPFTLLLSSLWRPFDHSLPALAEMITRGETQRLSRRVQSLIRFTAATAAVAAVGLALCNRDFVLLWTRGRIEWAAGNDALLGLWLWLLALAHIPVMLLITAKRVGWLSWLMLADGVCGIVLAHVLIPRLGIPGLLLAFLATNLLLHWHYGFRRTAELFSLGFRRALCSWLGPVIPVAALAGAAGWGVHTLLHSAPLAFRLATTGLTVALAGLAGILRWVLDDEERRALMAPLHALGARWRP